MGSTGNGETSDVHEAHIPSSSLEDFQGVTDRLAFARKIQDREERRKHLEALLRVGRMKGKKESLEDEVWEQLARIDSEQPTTAEQRFSQESSYAASKVAKNLEDLHTPNFEGLIVRTDGNGNVTDIFVKKVLPEEDAKKARNRRSLQGLPNSSAKKLIHIPDAPDHALRPRGGSR